MACLALSFFGGFEARLDGTPISGFKTDKTRALLSYLALEQARLHRRQALAKLFWPGYLEHSARASLRRALANLRQVLANNNAFLPFLLVEEGTIQFNPSSDSWIDVHAFRSLLEEEQPGQTTLQRLEEALKLYRGSFLEGFSLADCPEFDAWCSAVRQDLQRLEVAALYQLVEEYERQGELVEASQSVRRQLELEPWREEAHQQLMRLLALRGQRTAALAQFEICRKSLAEKLRVEPSAVTTRLYEQIRSGEIGKLASGINMNQAQPELLSTFSVRPRPRHNLPVQLSSFIGRGKEIAQVKELLEAHRLVTLTGSGGVGKTRLSIQVGMEVLERFADGAWLIDLAPLTNPHLVPQTTAVALGISEEAGHSILDSIAFFLRSRETLLILDNCEHLLKACGELTDALLRVCPHLKILVSSRVLLGVEGEAVFRVPSLSYPEASQAVTLEYLPEYSAVRLLVDRARLSLPDYQITIQNAAALVRICQQLDGIPLALEMAAARLNVLTAEQLAARLDDAFRLLTGGSRRALPRHQTLHAAIDWSYRLLSENERLLFHRLSVFAGGWTLEAAEDICKDEGGRACPELRSLQPLAEEMKDVNGSPLPPSAPILHPSGILDLLAFLVTKSMVIVERRQGSETRYRLLETVRQFAREKLVEAGESETLSGRHCQYFVQFAETGELKMRSAERLEWTRRLNADLDNLRAAIQWSYTGQRDIATGLRIAVAIGRRFMPTMGMIEEARQWLMEGLSTWDASSERLLHARALNVLGYLDSHYAVSTDTLQLFEESVRLCRSIGPAANAELSWALMYMSVSLIVFHKDWELETARRLMEESVAVARQLGPADRWYLAMSIGWLADLSLHRRIKDYPQIRKLAEENLQLRLQIGDRWSIGQALWTLAYFAESQGDFEQARGYFEQALALYQEGEDKTWIANTYRNLGRLFRHQGEYPMAISYHQEYLRIWDALGIRSRVSDGLRRLGVDRAFLGYSLSSTEKGSMLWQAAKSLGAAEKLSGNERVIATPADMEDYHKALELLHDQLDLAAFEKAWSEGQAMTLDEAVKYALSISLADPDG